MENTTSNTPEHGNASASAGFNTFFSYHLNRTYTTKLRMAEILDELLDRILFTDLAVAVRVTGTLVHGQIARLEEVYVVLNIIPSFNEPNELLNLIEESYLLAAGQQQQETTAFGLSVLAFLQSAESLELASFRVLNLAAKNFPDKPYVSELLQQCITEAEADYELLLSLMAKHLRND